MDDWFSSDAAFERDWELATGGNLMVGEEMFSSIVDSFINFGGYDDAIWSNPSNWSSGGEGKVWSGYSSDAAQSSAQNRLATESRAVAADSSGGSFLDSAMGVVNKVGSWAEENKTLAGLLGSGLLSALKGSNNPDYAAAVREKEQVDLRTRQRISDSLTGMPVPTTQSPGLLKRMNGSNVYTSGGKVAR